MNKSKFGVNKMEENKIEQAINNTVSNISVKQIVANRYQPRSVFDEQELLELAESVKQHGILQPIILRKVTSDMYEIIAGERRFRAAQLAGLEEVAAIVKDVSATEAAILALIENVQRTDLSAIEEAKSYEQLMFLYSKTQSEIAEMVGISQSAVANKLRLLQLAEEIQQGLEQKIITERHGRALLKVKDKEEQLKIYAWIVKKQLTVAETEKYIEKFLKNEVLKNEKNTTFFNVAKDTKLAVNTINKAVKTIQEFGMEVDYTKEEDEDNYVLKIIVPKNLVEVTESAIILPHEKETGESVHQELQKQIIENKQTVTEAENVEEASIDTGAIVVDLDLTSETIFFKPEDEIKSE